MKRPRAWSAAIVATLKTAKGHDPWSARDFAGEEKAVNFRRVLAWWLAEITTEPSECGKPFLPATLCGRKEVVALVAERERSVNGLFAGDGHDRSHRYLIRIPVSGDPERENRLRTSIEIRFRN